MQNLVVWDVSPGPYSHRIVETMELELIQIT